MLLIMAFADPGSPAGPPASSGIATAGPKGAYKVGLKAVKRLSFTSSSLVPVHRTINSTA